MRRSRSVKWLISSDEEVDHNVLRKFQRNRASNIDSFLIKDLSRYWNLLNIDNTTEIVKNPDFKQEQIFTKAENKNIYYFNLDRKGDQRTFIYHSGEVYFSGCLSCLDERMRKAPWGEYKLTCSLICLHEG